MHGPGDEFVLVTRSYSKGLAAGGGSFFDKIW